MKNRKVAFKMGSSGMSIPISKAEVNVFYEFKMDSPNGARVGELREKAVFVKV